ncbi:tetratricopeptide repeat protein [Nonomuraea antimicrobica]
MGSSGAAPAPETTLSYAAQALELATRAGATAQIAWSHNYAAAALRRLGRLDEAAESFARAARMFQAAGDVDAYCQSLSGLGDCRYDQGRHEEALETFLEVRALLEDDRSGMTPSIAALSRPHLLMRLGVCLRLLGRRAEAIAALTESVALMEQLHLANFSQAVALERLAALLAEEGRPEESSGTYTRAATLYEAIGDAEASSRCRDLAATTP